MYNPYQDILKLKKQIKWLKEKFECQLTNKCCDDNNDTPPADVIERTSQLINDGENGLQPFIVDAELSDKIINGNVFWLQSGLTFQSTNPITYRLAGTVFQAPEKTFVLDSADPVLSRIDVFAVNLQSEVVVVKGEPSLDPQEPAIEFGSQLRINSVLISAAATEPSNPNGEPITSTLVYNENLEEPNEWDNDVFNPLTNNVPSGQVIFNSTQSPSNGAVSIETTNLERLTTIRFKNDTKIDFATLSSIFFDFKSKVNSIYNCTIKLYDGTTLVKSTTFSNGENGLNTDISLSYQPVNVPASSFQSYTRPNTILFDTITFNFNIPNNTKSEVLPSFYLDKINLLFNSENPNIGTTFLNLSDVLESTYTGKEDTYVSPNAQGTGVVFKPIDDIKNDIDYNNLNNAPAKTSDFQNDGNGGDPFITINEVPDVPVLSVNGEEGEVIVDNISRTIYINPSEIDGMLDIKPQIVQIINDMNYDKTTEVADIFIRIEEEPRVEEEEEGLESFFVTTANECPPLTTVERTIFWKRKGIAITSIPEVGDEMYEDPQGTIPLSGVVPEGDVSEYLRLAESFMNTATVVTIDIGTDGVVRDVNKTVGCL